MATKILNDEKITEIYCKRAKENQDSNTTVVNHFHKTCFLNIKDMRA